MRFGVQNKRRYEMKLNRSKKKLQVRVTVENLGSSFPETKLDNLIQWFQNKRNEWTAEGFTNLELRNVSSWDYAYDLTVVGTRYETDKEFNARMVAVEKEKRQEADKMREHMKFIEAEAKKLGILK